LSSYVYQNVKVCPAFFLNVSFATRFPESRKTLSFTFYPFVTLQKEDGILQRKMVFFKRKMVFFKRKMIFFKRKMTFFKRKMIFFKRKEDGIFLYIINLDYLLQLIFHLSVIGLLLYAFSRDRNSIFHI